MARYLSQEWLDMQRDTVGTIATQDPGVSARLQHVVTGAPDGDVRYFSVIVDGTMVANTLGNDPDAQVTLTAPYEQWVKVLSAEVDGNVAYMRGKIKVLGDMGALLSVMPLTQRPGYKTAMARVAEQTDY